MRLEYPDDINQTETVLFGISDSGHGIACGGGSDGGRMRRVL